jgi:hypothetical protein
MVPSTRHTLPFPAAPTIDGPEARWVADELAGLIQRVGPDSVPGLILRQDQQELQSLVRSADGEPAVIGPVRIRVAA